VQTRESLELIDTANGIESFGVQFNRGMCRKNAGTAASGLLGVDTVWSTVRTDEKLFVATRCSFNCLLWVYFK
jgi:hypothetical protein